MTTYLITRHDGAKRWVFAHVTEYGLQINKVLPHLDPSTLERGDVVVGTLPIQIVADLCDAGITYYHLTLKLPKEKRGLELSMDELDEFEAHLERFEVRRWKDLSEKT
ncbi:CRISPR-associated protein Csx16 [Ferrithrix thermotolerans DSM 19514]|uniref:CRISPR-associated protein Csx16 n=1 Tax=Ferrithrix thermotolerans DSM 19514 TaxID=1121881 RepID=A0A1M4XMU0_9ACTN|nr:CRISPR-associated protein Csx16 [Ferrithrix thermotolerans]SHE94914.1 CRISPR-associated protein Csx16 [Ferrithrix thermotolerans DSM 19514]